MAELSYASRLASEVATTAVGPWWDAQVLIALNRRDTARLEWLVRIRDQQTQPRKA